MRRFAPRLTQFSDSHTHIYKLLLTQQSVKSDEWDGALIDDETKVGSKLKVCLVERYIRKIQTEEQKTAKVR